MNPSERFQTAMAGAVPDRVPVVPKIWLDLAARIMDVPFVECLNDPSLSMKIIVRAAMKLGIDGARLFTFSPRRVEVRDGLYVHLDERGRRLGTVDIAGGWASHFDDPKNADIARLETMFHYSHHASDRPAVQAPEDLERMVIPTADDYDRAGYGRMVEEIKTEVGGRVALIGDCSSGTLAFHVAMRGMSQALLDFFDDPGFVQESMARGTDYCIERAKFFLRHGVKTLRLNDSVANMTVISPAQWRKFIAPHFRRFCEKVHGLDAQAKVYCHICGNTLPIARDLVATGLDCLAPLDPLGGMTVAQMRQAVGPEVVLMGGVNTMSFVNASPDEIAREARRCMQEGGANGRYVLGSGCALPRGTKVENLVALREAAETVGRYREGALLS